MLVPWVWEVDKPPGVPTEPEPSLCLKNKPYFKRMVSKPSGNCAATDMGIIVFSS